MDPLSQAGQTTSNGIIGDVIESAQQLVDAEQLVKEFASFLVDSEVIDILLDDEEL